MRNNICLLLTATIEVRNKTLVKRHDTATRLNDYKIALKKWLTSQKNISKIVFAENSSYPLADIKKIVAENNIHHKEVEFISFTYDPFNDADISLAELKIIEYALDKSQLIKSSDYFAKMTGRLFVRNIDAIISGIPEKFDVISLLSENLLYMDSAIVFFEKNFYNNKIGFNAINTIRKAKYKIDFEYAYAQALHLALANYCLWYPFPLYPVIEGVSGTKNIAYNSWGRYNRWRAFKINLVSKMYHKYFRNSYGKNRKHIIDRWNLKN